MSKYVVDLVDEFHSLVEVEDDFELFMMSIKIDDSGEVTSTESIEPVSHIEIDHEHEECLLHISPNGKAISIRKVIKEISSINSDYFLCSAEENTIDGLNDSKIEGSNDNEVDDSNVRVDNSIIGFGENIEQRRFFVVCQAFENNVALH